jgi:hypothetical protein
MTTYCDIRRRSLILLRKTSVIGVQQYADERMAVEGNHVIDGALLDNLSAPETTLSIRNGMCSLLCARQKQAELPCTDSDVLRVDWIYWINKYGLPSSI